VSLFVAAPSTERASWLESFLDITFMDQSASGTSQEVRSSCSLAATRMILSAQFGDAANTELHIR
jgi:hypothetical protein